MRFSEKLLLKDLRLTAKIVLTFFLSLAVLIFLIHGIIVLGFGYPLDYGEGPLLNQARNVVQGKPLYPADITTPPFLIANYPPVFVLINAFFIWVFGPSLFIGRLIAFLSTLGTAILIGLSINHFYPQKDYLPSLTGVGVFLAIPYVLQWAPLYRIDMLALLFSMAGLYLIIKNPEKDKAIILASLLFILSVFTRQSYGLAAPLTAAIWIFTKNRKQAVKLMFYYTLGGLVLFGFLQWLTNGGFFFHTITANVNPFSWETVHHYAREIVQNMSWLIFLMIIFVLTGWRFTHVYFFLTPYLITGFLTAITIGKVGSNVNYLVEISAGLALLAGISIARLSKAIAIDPEHKPDMYFPKDQIPDPERVRPAVRQKLWSNLVIMIVITSTLITQVAVLTRKSLFSPVSNSRDRIKRGTDYIYLEENIKNAAELGPLLVDEYMAVLPKNNIPLYFEPFEMTQLASAGLWDQTPLLTSIANQDFPLILIHHFPSYPVYLERWTEDMRKEIFNHYIATAFRAESLFFTPKDHQVEKYPIDRQCPDVPWQIPTEANMGMQWYNGQLLMMGSGRSGEIPVYAIANGFLYQFPGWETAVAIRHDDPFNPGRSIWSFYGDLAPAFNPQHSYIEEKYINAEAVPVNAGDIIGYQGDWLGPNFQTWVHLRFTLLPAEQDGSFPQPLLAIHNFYANLPSYREQNRLGLEAPVSLTSFTGLPESRIFGTLTFLPFACPTRSEQ